MRYAVIMAGGSGTRLWPLSRQGAPKQLLPLLDGGSLLQAAWRRATGVVPPENVLVCTGAAYADEVSRQLPGLVPENLLGEPVGRDSLNAAAWPAAVLARRDQGAVMAVLTADHVITPEDVFCEHIARGFAVAEADASALVTFGVVPTGPHTGYGYLERGDPLPGRPDAAAVVAFTEKPDAATAAEWVASGRYWWNSGMFVWRVSTFLEQLRGLQPATHAAVLALAVEPDRLDAIYPALTRISIDYAIMEPVSRGAGSAHVNSGAEDGHDSMLDASPLTCSAWSSGTTSTASAVRTTARPLTPTPPITPSHWLNSRLPPAPSATTRPDVALPAASWGSAS